LSLPRSLSKQPPTRAPFHDQLLCFFLLFVGIFRLEKYDPNKK
jgi:hypothetical protein